MSLDNVGGGVSVQTPTDIGQGGIDKTDSVTSKAFNRSVSVESDVEATVGLKSDKPKSEPPSIRDRITTPVDSSQTRSVKSLAKQLAGKVADKVVPERLQEGASSLKAKAGKKARAALEFVSEKATTLKSATIGKLIRAIRSENWSKVDTQVRNPELQEKVFQHNQDVDKLADLKTKLKNEEAGLREFESQYKEALELLEHPGKFTTSSKPRTIDTPAGPRTIQAGDQATREKMVDMIKQDIMDTPEYKEHEYKRSQQKSEGTELFVERQNLKKAMKARAKDMVDMFKAEVTEDLQVQQSDVSRRKSELSKANSQKMAALRATYDQRTEEAKALKESKGQAVKDLKEERDRTKEVIHDMRVEKRRHKKDAALLRKTAARMRDETNQNSVLKDATDTESTYQHLKEGVGKAKKRVSDIPEELKNERKERKEARKAYDDLQSGKAKEKEIEGAAKEWEKQEKKLDKEEQQLEKDAKKKTKSFKKGLG